MKVFIKIEEDNIVFSKNEFEHYLEFLDNYVQNKKVIKIDDEILKNESLLKEKISLILNKKINKAIIKNSQVCEISLLIINYIKYIKYIYFEYDKELTYSDCYSLLENKNIKEINCYSIPNVMMKKMGNIKINTRCEYLFMSDIMNDNNIDTCSKIYNKELLVINKNFREIDYKELEFFFQINNNLNTIEIHNYSYDLLNDLLNFLKDNNIINIKIIIYENDLVEKKLIKDAKKFDKLEKKYNIQIKVKYSDEYKEKNKLKEINIYLVRWIALVCIVFAVACFCFSEYIQYKNGLEIKNELEEIQEIKDIVSSNSVNEVVDETQNMEEVKVDPKENNPYYMEYNNVYSELKKRNSDTVGLLKINNTNINYPIVQAKDNDYYLKHSYSKHNNLAGWIFVDYRNNMDNLDKNTIIYGHSISHDELMFGSLKRTLSDKWYKNEDNLIINLNIKGEDTKWQIFSIYTIQKTSDYLQVTFDSDDLYLDFIKLIKDRSINDFGVEVTENDKILTLSTCYNGSEERLVVHAKKI